MKKNNSIKDSFDVTCAGYLCLDIAPAFPDTGERAIEEILKPGTVLKVGPAQISTGGAVANTGIGLKVLGLRVAFMALVGRDSFGEMVIALLDRHGSSSGLARTSEANTGYSIAIAPPGIDRFFLHDPGTNVLFSSEHINYEIVAGSRIFHLGYPPLMRSLYRDNGQELVEIFRRVKELGVTTSLDLCLVDPYSEEARLDWRAIFTPLLPYVDLLLPSVEESFLCLYPEAYLALRKKVRGELISHIGNETFQKLGEDFLGLGCGVLMIKAGHQGIYLRTAGEKRLAGFGSAAPASPASWANRELWCPAFEVEKIASAVGAGDVSVSGFLSGLLAGRSLERSLKLAALAGYLNLRAVDSFSGLVDFDQCERMLDSGGLSLLPVGRELGREWDYDQEYGIYRKKA